MITTDERTEVRNSAIQTIQRIFENYTEHLSSEVWLVCLRTILFGMVEANLDVQRHVRSPSRNTQDLKDWDETTKTILRTVSALITTYLEKLDQSQLSDAWSELLGNLQEYFKYGSHVLGASVFDTITGVLSHLENEKVMGNTPLLKTASVWKNYFDEAHEWSGQQDGGQDAFVAYAEAFKAIYRLADTSLTGGLPFMLKNLEACIINSEEIAYTSDVDNMTTLQHRVLDCLSIVRTKDSHKISACVLQSLSRFILLPYTSMEQNPDKRGPTFVALSKASMTLLQEVAVRHIDQKEIYTDNIFASVLKSLAKPIQEKYVWQREGKHPTLWQKATTTTVAILEPGITHITAHGTKEVWADLVNIAHYITRAQLFLTAVQSPSLGKEEEFDIQAFSQLRELITLPLGSPALPDNLRRLYTRNLFSSSLVHVPVHGELPDIATAPLESLYKIRLGRTMEIESILRIEMSYACLSELFNLVAVHSDDNNSSSSTPERIKLAQAAAPYLILRAALPLKLYIADHPLRGCMPAPESQRRELLFVLDELYKLKCEPQAIPDAPGVKSKYRKHLHRLYPLLVKASKAARMDDEVFEKVGVLVEVVGGEFGLDEEDGEGDGDGDE